MLVNESCVIKSLSSLLRHFDMVAGYILARFIGSAYPFCDIVYKHKKLKIKFR